MIDENCDTLNFFYKGTVGFVLNLVLDYFTLNIILTRVENIE